MENILRDIVRGHLENAIRINSGCLIIKDKDNYHTFGFGGRRYVTHRLIAFKFNLSLYLLSDKQALHKCNVKGCCDEDHLYIGNESDNAIDAINNKKHGGHYELLRTHCPLGHEYNKENTYYRPCGKRVCRTCRRTRWKGTKSFHKFKETHYKGEDGEWYEKE